MKFLKTKNISKFSINDRSLIAYPNGNGPGNRIVLNAKGGMMLPKGSTAERPQLNGVRQPTDANGTIRYNTSLNVIEGYVGGTWVTMASPVVSAIVKETIGPGSLPGPNPGNGVERVFGPLNNAPEFVNSYSASPDNILVLVENVMQISDTNYTVVQSNGVTPINGNVYPAGWYINFTSPVPDTGSGGNPVYVTVYYGYAN